MKLKAIILALLAVSICVSASAQEQGQPRPAEAPPTDTVAKDVLLQITHLKTHPFVAARLAEGTLSIHGWVYDIGQGDVRLYDPVPGQFVSIDAVRATDPVEA